MSLLERSLTCNTLICLLKALESRSTTIELRNEASVFGKIDSVDVYMNVYLTNASFTSPDGSVKRFANFFVQGRQIRYVHIPDDVEVNVAIESQLALIRKIRSCKQPSKQRSYSSKKKESDNAGVN